MADFTQSLSDTVYTYGLQRSTKFGTAVFGTDTFGDGANNGVFAAPVDFTNINNDTEITSDAYSFSAAWNESFSDATVLSLQTSDEHENDGSGQWTYVLPGGVTNDEQANITTYAASANSSTAYSASVNPVTNWT